MKRLLYAFFIFGLAFVHSHVRAQLAVTPGATAQDVINYLQGQGVIISNVVINCPNNAWGQYSLGVGNNISPQQNTGFTPQGLLMTTGSVNVAVGPDNSESAGVGNNGGASNILGGNTFDRCHITFDFVSLCQNQVKFVYSFGSEEYLEYVNQNVNDQFGFFVCGGAFGACPPNGTQNVACVPPGPTPPACATGVSIDNVNSGTNPAFYFDNPGGTTTQYDGFTRNLEVVMNVTPLQTYTITLAIADLGDGIYDSGVFISPLRTDPVLQTITTNSVPTPLCPGDNFATNFILGQCPFDFYWVQLSDANGVFPPVPPPGTTVPGDPRPAVGTSGNIGNQTPSNAVTDIPSQIPFNTPAGTNYQVRVVGYAATSNIAGTPYTVVISNAAPNLLTVQPNITANAGVDQNLCVTNTSLDGVFADSTNPSLNLAPFGPFTPAWSFLSGPTTPTISGTDPITVTNMSVSGTYQFIYAVDGPCNDPRDTVTVVVNLPVADFTPIPPRCSNGATASLQATPAGGAFAGPGVTGTTFDPALAGVGVHTLTYSGALNGCAYSSTIAATVNAPPVLNMGSNAPICEGSTLNLSASAPAGTVFAWTGPNNFSSALQNPSIPAATTAATGTYSLNISVTGCTNASTLSLNVFAIPAAPAPANNGPICAGQTLQLTTAAVANATYNWTGPNGFSSAVQNPSISNATVAASGVYSLTVTVNNCTSPVGSTTAVVFPVPQITSITTNSPVCTGGTLNLSATTDVAGTATYTWFGPAAFISQQQNPTIANVTPANGGIYTVNVSVNGCTSPDLIRNVVILSLPVAQPSSNAPVCVGASLQLFAASLANGSYSWTGPLGFASTQQNPVITGATSLNAGVYTLIVTNLSTGCASLPVDITVTIKPLPPAPSVSNNGPLCVGQPLFLTASDIPGAVYTWSGPASFSSSAQNPAISSATTANSGVYTVFATLNGCVGASASTTVLVNNNPNAPVISNNGPICEGQTLQLTSNFIAGVTYHWGGPNGFTSNVQSPSIPNATTNNSGNYTLFVSINGCTVPVVTMSALVKPRPETPQVSGTITVCQGETITLAATTVSGASYSWTGPNGFTSTAISPQITNASLSASGTYNLTVSLNGCTSIPTSINVTVKPRPARPLVGNNGPICEGATLQLTAQNFPAGTQYVWSGETGFMAGVQNPQILFTTTSNSDTYYLYVIAEGCTSQVAVTYVTIKPKPDTPTASNNTPICEGQNLQLYASTAVGAGAFQWSGPNGFTSNFQNPVITNTTTANAGIYTVRALRNGCYSDSAFTEAIIKPKPPTPVVSSNSPVCKGQQINLYANTSGPALPGLTFLWTGPNSFNTSQQNPVIPNAQTFNSGLYTVRSYLNGCSSNPAQVSVNVINNTLITPAIGSNAPICEGGNLQLTAGFASGAIYAWSGPNGFSSSAQNPQITNVTTANSGTYSLVTLQGPCISQPRTITVTIRPRPVPTTWGNNGPICVGQTLNLTAELMAGVTYQWAGPNGFMVSMQNPSIYNVGTAASGLYTLTITRNGCVSLPVTMNVMVVNPPNAPTAGNNGPLCAGQTLQLTASTVVGASGYVWSGPGGFISTAQNPVIPNVNSTNAGTYTVVAVVSAGCASQPGVTDVQIPAYLTPTANFVGGTTTICEGTSTDLKVSVTGKGPWQIDYTANGVAQVPFSVGDASSPSPSSFNVTVSPFVTTTYTLTAVRSGSGCLGAANSTVVVFVNPKPTATFVNNIIDVCAGLTANIDITLTGKGPWTIEYVVGGSTKTAILGDASSPSPVVLPLIVTPTATLTYALTQVTDGNGCINSASGSLITRYNLVPQVNLLGSGSTCVGGTVTLYVQVLAAFNTPWTIEYLEGTTPKTISGLGNSTTPFTVGPIFAETVVQFLQIINTDAPNCVRTLTNAVTIPVTGGPTLTLTASGVDCQNSTRTITATATGGKSPYMFAIDGGVFGTNNVFTGLTIGNHTVTVKDGGGCTISQSTSVVGSLAVPTIVSVTNLTTTTALVTWNAVPGAQYIIRYKKVSDASFTVINNIPAVTGSTASFTLTNLTADTQYIVTVEAVCPANGLTSGPSDPSNFITPATANCNFTVRINDGVSPVIFCGNGVLKANVTPIPSSATFEWFKDGVSVATEQIFVATQSGIYTVTVRVPGCPPLVSQPFNVTIDNLDFILVTDTNPVTCGTCSDGWIKATAIITAQTIPDFEYSIIGPDGRTWQASNYFYNLPAGTYTVRARIKGSNCFIEKTVIVEQPATLPTPQIVSITNILTNRGTVNWLAVPGATSYTLRYRVAGSSTWTTITSIATITRILTNLQHSTQYEVQIQAADGSGNVSAWSNSAFFTTVALTGSCLPPSGIFTAPSGPTSVLIQWTNVANAACYDIDYRISGVWTTVSVPAPASAYNLTGLTPGAAYQLRVRSQCGACNGATTSVYSPTFNFTQPTSREGAFADANATDAQNVKAYPNPNNGRFTLSFDAQTDSPTTYALYDVTGRCVKTRALTPQIGPNVVEIDLETAGVYLLTLDLDGERKTLRVLVK